MAHLGHAEFARRLRQIRRSSLSLWGHSLPVCRAPRRCPMARKRCHRVTV